MENTNYPRILILGQPFNDVSGGGITLSNLFKGWPKEKIAVTSKGHVLQRASDEICNQYYCLGKEEQRWIFPFNFLQRSFPSGIVAVKKGENRPTSSGKVRLRSVLVDQIFFPLLHWLGLYHTLTKISVSNKLKKWLDEFKPETVYIQLSSREEILFAIKLLDYLKVPAFIHMMDDWPSTISKQGILKRYWKNKIDKEFRILLNRVDYYLSISDAMSAEYKKRYKKEFQAFHNPIDLSHYKRKKHIRKVENEFKILYVGRIGLANQNSISQFAHTISHYESDRFRLIFDIYSKNTLKSLLNLKNINVIPPIPHDKIPELLTDYDLLLLPLDFTETGIKFAKYSIPTKASEYMISGTPILVFAPSETAISKFCSINNCAFCLTKSDPESIRTAIYFLMYNADYRNQISENAFMIAKRLFDGEKVREKFQQLIINSNKVENYVHK